MLVAITVRWIRKNQSTDTLVRPCPRTRSGNGHENICHGRGHRHEFICNTGHLQIGIIPFGIIPLYHLVIPFGIIPDTFAIPDTNADTDMSRTIRGHVCPPNSGRNSW